MFLYSFFQITEARRKEEASSPLPADLPKTRGESQPPPQNHHLSPAPACLGGLSR